MKGSRENAANHLRRKGRSSTGGKPGTAERRTNPSTRPFPKRAAWVEQLPRVAAAGTMECRGYGPCEVPAASPKEKVTDQNYDEGKCLAVSSADVLHRMCGRMRVDEALYRDARAAFEQRARDAREREPNRRRPGPARRTAAHPPRHPPRHFPFVACTVGAHVPASAPRPRHSGRR